MTYISNWYANKRLQTKRVNEFAKETIDLLQRSFWRLFFFHIAFMTVFATVIVAVLAFVADMIRVVIVDSVILQFILKLVLNYAPVLITVLTVALGASMVVFFQRFIMVCLMHDIYERRETPRFSIIKKFGKKIFSIILAGLFLLSVYVAVFSLGYTVISSTLEYFGFISNGVTTNSDTFIFSALGLMVAFFVYVKSLYLFHSMAVEGNGFFKSLIRSWKLTKKQYWSGIIVNFFFYAFFAISTLLLIIVLVVISNISVELLDVVFEQGLVDGVGLILQVLGALLVVLVVTSALSVMRQAMTTVRYKKQYELNE